MKMRSSLEIYDLASGQARVILKTDRLIEAPNWDAARGDLIVNGAGQLYRVRIATGEMRHVPTEGLTHLNNDHGIAPDGSWLIVSDNIPGRGSVMYFLPLEGGTPERINREPGAYFHGWSPDGATLAFCGRRGGRFDIYRMPAAGGPEVRLTDEGHNDGPDFSPDGDWVWFNSDRTGHAQIWKMRADGSEQTQVTNDAFVNWFPHPSPCGAHVLYLRYPEGTLQHPRDKDVALVLMAPDGSTAREVRRFNGGQGSINVPCWAPDGSAFAYVRFE